MPNITAPDWEAIGLSVRLGLSIAVALLLLCAPLGYALARSQRRRARFLEALALLPWCLPPTTLGFILLVALGQRSPLGRLAAAFNDHGLLFRPEGLWVAGVVAGIPLAFPLCANAFLTHALHLQDAARTLGCTHTQAFFRVSLPLAAPGLVRALLLAFVHALGEFGVALVIGGNLAGSTRTASISIYDDVMSGDLARASSTALCLAAIALAALAVSLFTRRRIPRASRSPRAPGVPPASGVH